MGLTLEKSGIAERLLETMAISFWKIKGGLAYSVVIVGGMLAASTGIVGATVVTMGLISLPTMLKRGYDAKLANWSNCIFWYTRSNNSTICCACPPRKCIKYFSR